MKTYSFIILIILANYFNAQEFQNKFDDAVKVLNLGTFHMGYTSDANSTEFDEHNKENVRQIHLLAEKIAEFKPTIIVVEVVPSKQEWLNNQYQSYLQNPNMSFENPNEIQLLAYEVGRLSNTQKIFGIDFHEGYNYRIYNDISPKVDSLTYPRYWQMMQKNEEEYKKVNPVEGVADMLHAINTQDYLDYLININADILNSVSTYGQAQGADEAAKFYHRNLVMFSNLNQIPVQKGDRIFVLMGATHTAFFREWLKRSPKYILENTFDFIP